MFACWFPVAIIIDMAASCTNADVLASVIQKLGGVTLKDGEILALNSLLREKDLFAVLPPGYGKSLIYQCNALSMVSWKSLVVPRSSVICPLKTEHCARTASSQTSSG